MHQFILKSTVSVYRIIKCLFIIFGRLDMKYEAEQQMTRVDKLSCIAARGVREAAATYMCGRELYVTRARLTHSFVSVGSHDSHIMVENVNISINHCLPGYEQLV